MNLFKNLEMLNLKELHKKISNIDFNYQKKPYTHIREFILIKNIILKQKFVRLIFRYKDPIDLHETQKFIKALHLKKELLKQIHPFQTSVYHNLGSILRTLKDRLSILNNEFDLSINYAYSINKDKVYFICDLFNKRKYHQIMDFNVNNYSKHLYYKFLKVCKIAYPFLASFDKKERNNLYIDLSEYPLSSREKMLNFRYIKKEYLFLKKELKEFPKEYFWIPTKNQLKVILKEIEPDITKYKDWKRKSKLSIKCEELNLIAYIIEKESNKSYRDILFRKKIAFKINEFITLRLQNQRTNVYIKGRKISQCKRLIIQIPKKEIHSFDEIRSIDEIKDKFNHGGSSHDFKITAKQEFWGHASNLQAWVEHDYDTRLIDSKLAFPLLRELSKVGDPIAQKVFKTEILKRIESNYIPTIRFLFMRNFFEIFNSDELKQLYYEFKKDEEKQIFLEKIQKLIYTKRVKEELKRENIN